MKTKYLEIFYFQLEESGMGLWFDIFFSEEHFFTSGDLPLKHNPHRRALFCIAIKFMRWQFNIWFRYKHIGWVSLGRDLSQKERFKKMIGENKHV